MVHTLSEYAWLGLSLGLAIVFFLVIIAIARELLDDLFETGKHKTVYCQTCYGTGQDSTGKECSCRKQEK